MKNNLQDLLKWSIENSDSTSVSAQAAQTTSANKLKDLDPEVIDAILGKDEATLMKECMTSIMHPEVDLESKLIAFDNLEMLVEHIDNAKNLEPLKLWEPLLNLLSSEEPSLRKYSAWVIGTATQNNPGAQDSFIKHDGIEKVLEAFTAESISENLKKMVYSLSCSVRHHNPALNKFIEVEGFNKLIEKTKAPEVDASVKSRITFMFSSLIADDVTILKLLSEQGYFVLLADYLCEPIDEDFLEKILRLFVTATPYLLQEKLFPKHEKLQVQILTLKETYPNALSSEEWTQLIQCISTC